MQLSSAHSPKYMQLAELFRQRIAKGVWRQGERLPTLAQLCEEYDIARVTARQAMDQLVREGLVLAQRGRGTFVTGEVRPDHWLRVETTLARLAEVYRDTQPTILAIDESDSARAPLLQADEGVPAKRYIYMRRVHAREGRPYCVIGIHLDADVFARDPQAFRTGTVIPLLTQMRGLKIASARQVLTIGTADLEVARHLGVSVNAPVAEVRRVFTDAKRRVIYVAEVTYRGDFVRVDFDLKAG